METLIPSKKPVINEGNLRELSFLVSLKIKGKTADDTRLKWFSFFSDLVAFSFSIPKDEETKEIKSNDFFDALSIEIPATKYEKLFTLIQ